MTARKQQPTRYRLVNGKYRVIHPKPPQKPAPKPRRQAPRKVVVRRECPSCHGNVKLIVPYRTRVLSFDYHNRRRPGGSVSDKVCTMAMQPVEEPRIHG